MPNTNKIPNQNDLFDIFKSYTDTISEVSNVILQSGISKNTAKRIKEISQSMVVINSSMMDLINNLPKINERDVQNFTAFKTSMVILAGDIYEILGVYSRISFVEFIDTQFGIWRMNRLLSSVKRLVGTIGLITPISISLANLVVKEIAKSTIFLSDMARSIRRIPIIGLNRSVRRLYQILFGYKPGKAKKDKDAGLIDIFIMINAPQRLKALLKASFNVKLMVEPTRKLIGLSALMGLALPLIASAVVAVKLMKVVVNGLLYVFKISGRNIKQIIKGSITLHFVINTLVLFVAGMILVGAGVMIAWKPIILSIVFITSIVLFLALLGGFGRMVKRGSKTIMYIAGAVALIGMVAMLTAVIAQFVTANIAGFFIVVAYMVALVGVFIMLAAVSDVIKRGGKNIIRIAICVTLISLVAITLAFLAQFIRSNIGGFISVVLWMFALLVMIEIVARMRETIIKADESLLLIGVFALGIALIMGILMVITRMGDIPGLIILTVIMMGIIIGLVKIAIYAGKMQKEIIQGVDALAIIGVMAISLAGVMILLAIAAAIANPLLILGMVVNMTLVIVAVGGLAITAGMLLSGPQAAVFALGVSALGAINIICAAIGVTAAILAGTAKKVRDSGFSNAEEIAGYINMPFAALIHGDENGESIFDIFRGLPGVKEMLRITVKVMMLSSIATSIGRVADILQHIASLNMPDSDKGYDENGKPLGWRQMKSTDFTDAATNAGNILSFFADLFADKPIERKTADGKTYIAYVPALNGLDNIMPRTRRKIKRLGKIASYIGLMADTLQHIASLNVPDPDKGYDENGKPLGWKQMKGTDFSIAAINTGNILSFFADLFTDKPVKRKTADGEPYMVYVPALNGLDNIMPRTRRKIKRLNDIVTSIGNIATTLQNVATLKIPTKFDENGKPTNWESLAADNFTKVTENVKLIAQTLIGAIASDDLSESLNSMNKKSAKNLARILESIGNINSIMDVVKQLGEDKYVKTWKIDENGNKIPDTYGSYTVLLKKSKTIETNIKTMIGIIVNPFSQYNRGKDERNLHGAADEIKTISNVINDGSDIINRLIKIYNDDLVKFSIDDYGKRWDIQIDVVSSMLKTIGGVKININDAKTIANNLDKAADLVKHINSINEVNVTNLKMATGLINQTFGNTNIDKNSAKTIANNIDKTNDLIKRINKVNPDNLKTATKLMEHISKLSESIRGDFDGLAKAINENLLKALEKLTKALDDINEKEFNVHKESNVSTIGGAIAPSGSAGVKDKQQQIKQAQQPQTNKNILTKKDIADLKSSIDAIRNIFDGIVTTDRKVQVKI